MKIFDEHIRKTLKDRLVALEEHFKSDVIFFYGAIHPSVEKIYRDFIEKLRSDSKEPDGLTIILNTPGGTVETVEKLVDITRFHYNKVYFVVPDYAMSAGTIFCMSGNKIFMDYSSSLGPIDPQVFNGKEYVPALGYLDQVEKMLQKSAEGKLTDAEFLILQSLDLAMLSRYEQARNLTITLLKKWLVEHKFQDWKTHQTTQEKLGNPVTKEEKEQRAEEIARILGDNKIWHSLGRMIGVSTLTKFLRLKIEDYSDDVKLREKIRNYNEFLIEYIMKEGYQFFLHSKNYF
jgi:Serine dehydrogenase proteinase